jgi:RNA polymerase sigma-54 factor
MALEQKLRLKLAQRLVMTPSLQQAIKLLQLSRLELEETLAQEILENPLLDVEEVAEDGSGDSEEVNAPAEEDGKPEDSPGDAVTEDDPLPSEEETYDDIDVEAFFADYLGDGRVEGPSMAAPSLEQDNRLENVVSTSGGLSEHLHWQLHLLDLDPVIIEVCEFIIGNLDEDGFLRANDEEIVRGTGCDSGCVVEALAVVRSLDPPGIAASSLQDCLAAQLEHLMMDADAVENGDEELLRTAHVVITEHWDELLHQKWESLAKSLGYSELVEIKPILDVIQGLELKPGRIFRQDNNQYIEPDVYVRKLEEEYTIALNDDGLPRLRINSRYQRMLEAKNLDPKANEFLRDKMRSAMWLMKSIDQRQRTIYKVAQSIVSFQKDFLDNGIEHLRPMVLRQVAEDIGMHESTISRVVSNKFMYTPRGLFPMKYFFHSGVDSARGENVSSMVVKERIRKVVEAEDPARPLSDSKIMRMLQKEGIRLARRTVAKYREEMMIPSSDKRKKVF